MTTKVFTLVLSSTAGRYALDTPNGRDVTTGMRLELWLGGQWIAGRVEHELFLYSNRGPRVLGETPPEPRAIEGYLFETRDDSICGLCVGMRVRLSEEGV